MRPSLDEIEQIERYLLQEMSSSELLLFEQELSRSIDLQEKVEVQKLVVRGIERSVFKQAALAAFTKSVWIKKLWWGGAMVTTGIIIIVSIIISQSNNSGAQIIPDTKDQNQTITDTAEILNFEKPHHKNLNSKRIDFTINKPIEDSVLNPNIKQELDIVEPNISEEPKRKASTANEYKRKYDTLWAGQSIKDESLNIVVAKFSANIKNTLILLADGTTQSDLEAFHTQLWSINDRKTKITINNQVYPMKWDNQNISFKVKLKLDNTYYNFVFKSGDEVSVSSGAELNLKIKEKK